MDNNIKEEIIIRNLLEDDYFIESVLEPSKESIEYWQNKISEGYVTEDIFNKTSDILLSISQLGELEIKDDRLNVLWDRICHSNKEYRKLHRKNIIYRISTGVSAVVAAVAIFFAININNDKDSFSLNGFDIDKIPLQPATSHISLVTQSQRITLPGNDATVEYSEGEVKVNSKSIESINTELAGISQLSVPVGKKSQILLPDSSVLWVNAGSKVLFPTTFSKDRREIFVEGEVYADVKKHKNWPFIVKTKNLNVRVLGTQFNVKAYNEDIIQSVVLVNGSVEVKLPDSKSEILKPNQILSTNGSKTVVKNVDVDLYVAWKDGKYIFKQEKISEILARLSRFSGEEIVCPAEVGVLTCSGTLLLRDDIIQIMDGLCRTAPIQYTKQGSSYVFELKP